MDQNERLARIDELDNILRCTSDADTIAYIQRRKEELRGVDLKALEKQFHTDMLSIYKTAKADCGYTATRFLQLVSSIGGLAAAKQLIAKPGGTDGFAKLYECGRLDLSVEAHVLKEKYAELFTDEEKQLCRERLKQYGFKAVD